MSEKLEYSGDEIIEGVKSPAPPNPLIETWVYFSPYIYPTKLQSIDEEAAISDSGEKEVFED